MFICLMQAHIFRQMLRLFVRSCSSFSFWHLFLWIDLLQFFNQRERTSKGLQKFMSLHAQTARHLGLIYNFTLKKQNGNVKRSSSFSSRKKKNQINSCNFSWNDQCLNSWRTYTNPHKPQNDRNLTDISGLVRMLVLFF